MVLVLGAAMVWSGRLEGEAPVAVETFDEAPPPEPAPLDAGNRASEPDVADRAIGLSEDAALARDRESGWERVAPRPALGPSTLAEKPVEKAPVSPPDAAPGTPEPTLLFRPVATAAGRIEVAGHVIELDGISVLDPAARCDGKNGFTWPCGAVSRAAFRSWLRGRAVECTVTPAPLPKPVLSACRMGRQDAAEWLVRNGWAEALPGGPYEEAGAQAKAGRLGIFGEEQRRVSVIVGGEGAAGLPSVLEGVSEPAPEAPPETPVQDGAGQTAGTPFPPPPPKP